jgi:hypothetical protein
MATRQGIEMRKQVRIVCQIIVPVRALRVSAPCFSCAMHCSPRNKDAKTELTHRPGAYRFHHSRERPN